GSLREEIEAAAEASPGFPRTAREPRPHPAVARDETHDARGLEVVERVQDDRFTDQQRHAEKYLDARVIRAGVWRRGAGRANIHNRSPSAAVQNVERIPAEIVRRGERKLNTD